MSEENGMLEQMNGTIKNGVWTLLILAFAPSRFWSACFYGDCNVPNGIAYAVCRMTTEELLAGVKPSVRYWGICCSNVWAGIDDKERKPVNAKARSGVQLPCLSYGKS